MPPGRGRSRLPQTRPRAARAPAARHPRRDRLELARARARLVRRPQARRPAQRSPVLARLRGRSARRIFLLLEHQSTADSAMPRRVLSYQSRIWDRFRDERPAARLPPVLAILVSHVRGGWSVPTLVQTSSSIRSYFALPGPRRWCRRLLDAVARPRAPVQRRPRGPHAARALPDSWRCGCSATRAIPPRLLAELRRLEPDPAPRSNGVSPVLDDARRAHRVHLPRGRPGDLRTPFMTSSKRWVASTEEIAMTAAE